MGNAVVTKGSTKKLNTEMFGDLPVLQRKWQAAMRPGERLPRYEDVMLVSLGRLADHIVLLKNKNEALEVSRTGLYVQNWLNDERWDIPLEAVSPDCATVLSASAGNALENGRPFSPPRIVCAMAWSAARCARAADKIDRSFVKDLAKRSDCVAIVRAISGLGRSLNVTTTAEGVETMDQFDWLRAEGCNEVQGYLFSAAKPAAEVEQLLFRFGARETKAE